MDTSKHKSGKVGTWEDPKRDTEVQCLMNLVDWQMKLIRNGGVKNTLLPKLLGKEESYQLRF